MPFPAETRNGCCVAALNSALEDSSSVLVSLVVSGCGCGCGDSARSRPTPSLGSMVRSVFLRRHEGLEVSEANESRERLVFWLDEFAR